MEFSEKDLVRFWSKVDKSGDCWLWTGGCFNHQYGNFLYNGKYIGAHRASFMILHKRPITEGLYILHSCDNPKCVNPSHLREGTHQENMNDKAVRNRCNPPRGEANVTAKLTEAQIIEIRNKYAFHKISHRQLAKEYKVEKTTISKIINRKTWKHLD